MLFSAERHPQRPCALSGLAPSAALRPQRHSQSPWCPKRPRSPRWPCRLQRLWPGTREPGAVWATCLHNLEAVGSTFDCQCRSFLFLFVFARELGALKKIEGKSGEFLVLGRGYLGSRETFAPPPQLRSSSCAPGSGFGSTGARHQWHRRPLWHRRPQRCRCPRRPVKLAIDDPTYVALEGAPDDMTPCSIYPRRPELIRDDDAIQNGS